MNAMYTSYQWQKYISKTNIPDTKIEGDIRSKIELWRYYKDRAPKDFISSAQLLIDICSCIQDDLLAYESRQWVSKLLPLQELQADIWSTIRNKIDESTLTLMESIETQLKKTKEELASQKDNKSKQGSTSSKKPEDYTDNRIIKEQSKDIKIGFFVIRSDKQFSHNPVDFGELKMQFDIPRHMHQSPQLIMRATWTSYNDYSSKAYLPDIPIGGVMSVDIFSFPPLAKPAKKWVMRMINSSDVNLKKHPYPDPNNPATKIQPLKAYIPVASYVWIPHDSVPTIGWWNDKQNIWSSEGISQVVYSREGKSISLNTLTLAPLAYIIKRNVDFPYTSWKIRSVKHGTAILDIVTKRDTFVFEIGEGYAMLIDRKDPELAHLIGKEMDPLHLIFELFKSGINLHPVAEDSENSEFSAKSESAEDRAIFNLAYMLDAYSFRSTKWNKKLQSHKIAAKMRENLEYDKEYFEDIEKDWTHTIFTTTKCSLVRLREDKEDQNEAYLPNTMVS